MPRYSRGGFPQGRSMVERALSYCAGEVRRHDPDRFLTALFAPAERREDLFALYAFNLEVARTREMVSEALLGRMRLEWWRETIEGVYAGNPRRHEVARPLAEAVGRARLSRIHFDRLIDAREADFEDVPPASLEALVAYAEATSSSLVALALEVLGVRGAATDSAASSRDAGEGAPRAPAAAAVAREVGIAWALTGLLRAVPFHAQHRRLYLPADLMASAGAKAGELFERGRTSGLALVVERVATRAREHLAAARRLRPALSPAALPALLPATLADAYLAELRRKDFDPFALDHRPRRVLKPLRLALAAMLARY